MKKDIFNFHRFGKYFMSDIRTCTANYGLSIATLSILSFTALYVIDVALGLMARNGWSGPEIGLRGLVFFVVMFCIVITMPVKCYGKLTEKQYGSQWLMIPASKLEKFLSMTILTCIIVPVVGGLLYLGIDAMFCAIDPTCGKSVMSGIIRFNSLIDSTILMNTTQSLNAEEYRIVEKFVSQVANPWLYIDDGIQLTLPFLLGALCFKSGKTVKTFLTLAAASVAISIISYPIMLDWSEAFIARVGAEFGQDNNSVEVFFDSWLARNITLFDTISDTITNIALFTAIYFRIKTLKH